MGELLTLDYTRPRRQDLALAIACMRAHANTLRRAMMAATTPEDASARLGNTQRIREAAQRLELALSAIPRGAE